MVKKIAFVGASGNGISPLEQIMIKKGYQVFGSDVSFDEGRDSSRKQALQEIGLNIIPQDGSGISPDMEALYISTIIDEKNPDVKKAREFNIPIRTRYELLNDILSEHNNSIAVGGTAGKTTTTAMIGYILHKLGKKPCMVNGGALCNFSHLAGIPNYLYSDNSDYCVVEADESNGSIQHYHPRIGVINNISLDHTSIETLIQYFSNFANNITDTLVINKDCEFASKISSKQAKTITFSTKDSSADVYASNITPTTNGVSYQLCGKTYQLNILGCFNIANALAAISCCKALGIEVDDAASALESFQGVKVRLEKIGKTNNNVVIYNDFAHNAEKLKASILALKEHPGRVIAMYQPHTPFSVTNARNELGLALKEALSSDDILIMQEIYEKTPSDEISSNDVVEDVKKLGHNNSVFFATREPLKQYLIDNAKADDKIVIMGAHDNSLADFSKELCNLL